MRKPLSRHIHARQCPDWNSKGGKGGMNSAQNTDPRGRFRSHDSATFFFSRLPAFQIGTLPVLRVRNTLRDSGRPTPPSACRPRHPVCRSLRRPTRAPRAIAGKTRAGAPAASGFDQGTLVPTALLAVPTALRFGKNALAVAARRLLCERLGSTASRSPSSTGAPPPAAGSASPSMPTTPSMNSRIWPRPSPSPPNPPRLDPAPGNIGSASGRLHEHQSVPPSSRGGGEGHPG